MIDYSLPFLSHEIEIYGCRRAAITTMIEFCGKFIAFIPMKFPVIDFNQDNFQRY